MVNKEIENKLIERLYNVIPLGSLYMQELLKLIDIVVTDDDKNVSTACISCDVRPIMTFNINFVNEYCKTDEHLFMLVMHELYHKILGHTTLFKNHDEIDNIAFDAIINAMLCREYSDEIYTSFFKNVNDSSTFPACILRPIDENTPKNIIPLLNNLYENNYGTYYDVYEEIKKHLIILKVNYTLLGEHDLIKNKGNKEEEDELLKNIEKNKKINNENKLFKEFIEKIIEKWPRPPKIITGRDDGGDIKKITVLMDKKIKMKKIFRKLLLEAGVDASGVNIKKINNIIRNINIQTFIPNYKDRTFLAKNTLINGNIIYNKDIDYNILFNEKRQKTYIYLDVSGSVYEDLKEVVPLLKKSYKNKEIELYAFSTIVDKVGIKNFMNGKFNSTGGTSINCVLKHLMSLEKYKIPKKILILTDGYVGAINSEYEKQIKNNKIKVYVGLFGEFDENSLKNISKKIVKVG